MPQKPYMFLGSLKDGFRLPEDFVWVRTSFGNDEISCRPLKIHGSMMINLSIQCHIHIYIYIYIYHIYIYIYTNIIIYIYEYIYIYIRIHLYLYYIKYISICFKIFQYFKEDPQRISLRHHLFDQDQLLYPCVAHEIPEDAIRDALRRVRLEDLLQEHGLWDPWRAESRIGKSENPMGKSTRFL